MFDNKTETKKKKKQDSDWEKIIIQQMKCLLNQSDIQ